MPLLRLHFEGPESSHVGHFEDMLDRFSAFAQVELKFE